MRHLNLTTAIAILAVCLTNPHNAQAGSIFLTGHDPDFHAQLGGNAVGARDVNIAAISFILDPSFNPYAAAGKKFLFVESSISPPGGHTDGEIGLMASGYTPGVDYVRVNASGLNAAINALGTTYSGIVVASDFGGILTQAELDILNARSADIISFLNNGGGLYAMAEGNSGAGLTPNGGWFGFLPFVTSSTAFNQTESGFTVTPFGGSLGLTSGDINGNASHNIFNGTFGLNIVDQDSEGHILSLAGRGTTSIEGVAPEPASIAMLAMGIAGVAGSAWRRRKGNSA